jgi:tetratricopeptide (TPR) repeat protein
MRIVLDYFPLTKLTALIYGITIVFLQSITVIGQELDSEMADNKTRNYIQKLDRLSHSVTDLYNSGKYKESLATQRDFQKMLLETHENNHPLIKLSTAKIQELELLANLAIEDHKRYFNAHTRLHELSKKVIALNHAENTEMIDCVAVINNVLGNNSIHAIAATDILATHYINTNQNQKAIELILGSLEAKAALYTKDNKVYLGSLNALANIHLKERNYEKAMNYYKDILTSLRYTVGQTSVYADYCVKYSEACTLNREYTLAEFSISNAIAVYKSENKHETPSYAHAYVVLSNIQKIYSENHESKKSLDIALSIYEKCPGHKEDVISILQDIKNYYLFYQQDNELAEIEARIMKWRNSIRP